MTDQARLHVRAGSAGGRPARKRHWWRWIVAALAGLVALIVLAAGLIIKLSPVPPPLALPTGRPSAPAGPLNGTWAVAPGSVAGFRLAESAIGFSNDVVGRTSGVTGTIVIAGDQAVRAVLHIALAGLRVSGKTKPQLASSLHTRQHPVAMFTLTRPVLLGPALAAGTAVRVRAAGQLTMNGATHPAAVSLAARRDGTVLQAAGTIPVGLAVWGIRAPAGFGVFGSLASHGVAEFALILHRAG
ncbi:MAG TPA: YceI family protein [Streptosporangiaceae bacterium]|nr:YceI family protein [Streptosporangiaceae bacterium]